MKTTQYVSIFLLTLICLNTYAQKKSNETSVNQLKAEILQNLNDKSNNYFFSYNDPEKGWGFIKIIEATNFDSYNLIIKAKKGKIISASVVKNLEYNTVNGIERVVLNNTLIIGDNNKNQDTRKIYRLFYALHGLHRSEIFDKTLVEFQETVKNNNTLSEKPTITEEQRKYIVQANSKNEKKEYQEALDFYKKVINVNPTSYPSAYYNMALLAAQIKDYRYAIFNMKKYMILVPDAPDARASQDQIYKWEAEIEK
jgi:tetratricopeptide (TPR) repeat protein